MRATPDFDFALTESAQMIREVTGRFADEQIAPLAARADAEDWFPRAELWPAMGELGLHGITVEEGWGGLGLGYHVPRLAFQPVLIWLALWVSAATDWPWRTGRAKGGT